MTAYTALVAPADVVSAHASVRDTATKNNLFGDFMKRLWIAGSILLLAGCSGMQEGPMFSNAGAGGASNGASGGSSSSLSSSGGTLGSNSGLGSAASDSAGAGRTEGTGGAAATGGTSGTGAAGGMFGASGTTTSPNGLSRVTGYGASMSSPAASDIFLWAGG